MIQYVAVLPAYAGMFPSALDANYQAAGSPRVCGDVSDNYDNCGRQLGFSPRMRGCFLVPKPDPSNLKVLPAYAGMFLDQSCLSTKVTRSPRVCGDVSRRN